MCTLFLWVPWYSLLELLVRSDWHFSSNPGRLQRAPECCHHFPSPWSPQSSPWGDTGGKPLPHPPSTLHEEPQESQLLYCLGTGLLQEGTGLGDAPSMGLRQLGFNRACYISDTCSWSEETCTGCQKRGQGTQEGTGPSPTTPVQLGREARQILGGEAQLPEAALLVNWRRGKGVRLCFN
jgi:hypothetical protein